MPAISRSPAGMMRRAIRSPTWKITYSPAADPSPVAKSRSRTRSRRIAGSVASAETPRPPTPRAIRSQHCQADRDVGAQDEHHVDPVRGLPTDLRRKRGKAVPGVLGHVTPLIPVEDRRHQQPDGQRDDQEVRVEGAGHREVGADHHQGPHQEEDEWEAERAVLVLERWGGIEIAANEADQSEQHDGPSAMQDQEDAHQEGKDESRPGDHERIALAYPAFENRH